MKVQHIYPDQRIVIRPAPGAKPTAVYVRWNRNRESRGTTVAIHAARRDWEINAEAADTPPADAPAIIPLYPEICAVFTPYGAINWQHAGEIRLWYNPDQRGIPSASRILAEYPPAWEMALELIPDDQDETPPRMDVSAVVNGFRMMGIELQKGAEIRPGK